MGESRIVRLVPNIRDGVWIIECISSVMSLTCLLNYKDKLFDK